MDDALEILQKEFCPPLDPALVIALAHDFADLGQAEQLAEAREVLEPIKQSALDEEQNSTFDPSGTSGNGISFETHDAAPRDQALLEPGHGAHSADFSRSESTGSTDLTSVSNGISSLRLDHAEPAAGSNSGYGQAVDQMDQAGKEALLQKMFPTQKVGDIAFILRKCNGDFGLATDELLTRTFLEDAEDDFKVPRGIEGFAESSTIPKKTKGKRGKKAKRSQSDDRFESPESPSPGNATQNVWTSANQDIDFLASHTQIPRETLRSLYHDSGASLQRTIDKLLTIDPGKHNPNAPPQDDPVLSYETVTLVEDFPSIAPPHVAILLRIAWPETAQAHKLAKALVSSPAQTGRLEIIMQHAPLDLSDEPSSSAGNAGTTASTSASRLDPHRSYDPDATVDSTRAARNQAFNQASNYARLGRSNPLMRSAAGYYASVGHAHNTVVRTTSAAAADAWIEETASRDRVDLHGLGVSDGVRIARTRVKTWWDGLGEAQEDYRGWRANQQGGFVIVTGKGKHSAGGVGKMGPAVLKMLVAEGWKVQVDSGALVVKGVARR